MIVFFPTKPFAVASLRPFSEKKSFSDDDLRAASGLGPQPLESEPNGTTNHRTGPATRRDRGRGEASSWSLVNGRGYCCGLGWFLWSLLVQKDMNQKYVFIKIPFPFDFFLFLKSPFFPWQNFSKNGKTEDACPGAGTPLLAVETSSIRRASRCRRRGFRSSLGFSILSRPPCGFVYFGRQKDVQ